MDRKPTPQPQPDPAATNNANEVQREGDYKSTRKSRADQPPSFPENEGLVNKKPRKDAEALGGVEGEALEEAQIASQRGRII